MRDSLGDIGQALNGADQSRLEERYAALRLDMVYEPEARAVEVEAGWVRVVSASEGRVAH